MQVQGLGPLVVAPARNGRARAAQRHGQVAVPCAKTLPTGQQDDGEYPAVHTTRLTGGVAATSTATVTIRVF